jgi:hypothetical protein
LETKRTVTVASERAQMVDKVRWARYNVSVDAIVTGTYTMEHVSYVVGRVSESRRKFRLVIGRAAGAPQIDEHTL